MTFKEAHFKLFSAFFGHYSVCSFLHDILKNFIYFIESNKFIASILISEDKSKRISIGQILLESLEVVHAYHSEFEIGGWD